MSISCMRLKINNELMDRVPKVDPEDVKIVMSDGSKSVIDALEQEIYDLKHQNNILLDKIKRMYNNMTKLYEKLVIIDNRTKKKKDGDLDATYDDIDFEK